MSPQGGAGCPPRRRFRCPDRRTTAGSPSPGATGRLALVVRLALVLGVARLVGIAVVRGVVWLAVAGSSPRVAVGVAGWLAVRARIAVRVAVRVSVRGAVRRGRWWLMLTLGTKFGRSPSP